MMTKREMPEVNAGSMADIAFLLLIFFLVTTTLETNEGIKRMLPRDDGEKGVILEKNILRVNLNAKDELMVEGELTNLKELQQLAIAFLDNGGATKTSERFCDYCHGERLTSSSDNPQNAIISVSTSRNTSYETFVAVQNELMAAYNLLREREAKRLFNQSYADLKKDYENAKNNVLVKSQLTKKLKRIQDLFPMKISEAELKNETK